MNSILQRILDLKKEIQTPKTKLTIQRLQQSLDESNSKVSTSEKGSNNNLANIGIENDNSISKENGIKEEERIERFLFNRYNR